MKASALVPVAAAFLVGAALAWFFKPEADAPAREAIDAPKTRRGAVKEPGSAAELARLGKRVRELEAQLAAARAQPPRAPADERNAAETNVAERTENAARPPRGPEGFRRHLEEMAKNDPARYTQMTNRMAQWRSRRIQQTQDKLDFFASLDASRMTPQQRETHEKLQDLLARREELFDLMRPDGDASDEQRDKARQELPGVFHELNELEKAERDMLLGQTADNLGLKGEAAEDLVNTVRTIYEATQSWSWGPGGHGRHGGRGGGRRR